MSTPTSSTLFDSIKNLDQMGFDTSGNFTSVKKNLDIFNQYTNASLYGNSSVLSNPIGKRTFMQTADTCTNIDGKKVNRNVLIDNMRFVQTGSTSPGLIPSAIDDINQIDTDFNKNANENCVPVTIVTDTSGNTTSGYVSVEDYQHIDCTAFPKNCKPLRQTNTITGGNGISLSSTICEECSNIIPITPTNTTEATESFGPYHKCMYCDNAINSNSSTAESDFNVFDTHNSNIQNKDPVVSIYIASVSIIGLYILYKMLYVHR